MRSRNAAVAGLLGLAVIGCGQAEIVPMTPPGVAYKRVATEGMEAEGEQRNRAAIRPKEATGEDAPTPASSTVQPRPDGDAGAK